ncbi:MAG: hypothetical protein AAF802_08865 [Planctomycetota bacterium]
MGNAESSPPAQEPPPAPAPPKQKDLPNARISEDRALFLSVNRSLYRQRAASSFLAWTVAFDGSCEICTNLIGHWKRLMRGLLIFSLRPDEQHEIVVDLIERGMSAERGLLLSTRIDGCFAVGEHDRERPFHSQATEEANSMMLWAKETSQFLLSK